MDLRGFGASDKPPRGYDVLTLAADVAGLVVSLGERNAMIVGSDVGGLVAWSVAARDPESSARCRPSAHRTRSGCAAVLTDPAGRAGPAPGVHDLPAPALSPNAG